VHALWRVGGDLRDRRADAEISYHHMYANSLVALDTERASRDADGAKGADAAHKRPLGQTLVVARPGY
jgi:hypothetical protein